VRRLRLQFAAAVFAVALEPACGGNSAESSPASLLPGRTGAAMVPSGVQASSPNYRYVGGVAALGQTSSSPNFKFIGGIVGATQ
jgi:hypothetical protein